MSSLMSHLLPLAIRARGSKREFASAGRTLARVAALQRHPEPHEPRGLGRTPVERRTEGGWPVYELGRADAANRTLFLHGGVYIRQILGWHWRHLARLAAESDTRFTVPIYPLAPAGVAGEVVPATTSLASRLIEHHRSLTVMGDSAGGGLALAVVQQLADAGAPAPRALVLQSPWLDVTMTDPAIAELDRHDPWLAAAGMAAAGDLYRAELPGEHPFVSPINGRLDGLPRTLVFSGTRDILNADARRFVRLARAAGSPVDYHEGPGMLHNYPLLPLPEGTAARAVIAAALAGPGRAETG